MPKPSHAAWLHCRTDRLPPNATARTLPRPGHRARLPAAMLLVGALLFSLQPAHAGAPDLVASEVAQTVYAHCADLVHHDRPQALLRAVVVLRLRLDEHNRWQAEVFRDNPQQPEMTRVALDSVARLPPAQGLSPQTLDKLHGEGVIEAWLFEKNGRFALKTLAKPQKGA